MITKWILRLCAIEGLLFISLMSIAFRNDHTGRAIIGMTWGIILFWVVLAGGLMYRYQAALTAAIHRIPASPRVQFVLVATVLALLEEVVTTAMSNLGPLFGVDRGEVMVTASTNYFEVVFGHSVIIFVPMFIVWSWLMSRYDIRPSLALLLFGITGTLAETVSFGPQMLLGMGFWVFVYGLMIYLPAIAFRRETVQQRRLRFFTPVTVILPLLASVPVALVVLILRS